MQLRHKSAGVYDEAQTALTAYASAASILLVLFGYELLLGDPTLAPQLRQALAEIPQRSSQLLRVALALRRQVEAQQPAMRRPRAKTSRRLAIDPIPEKIDDHPA